MRTSPSGPNASARCKCQLLATQTLAESGWTLSNPLAERQCLAAEGLRAAAGFDGEKKEETAPSAPSGPSAANVALVGVQRSEGREWW